MAFKSSADCEVAHTTRQDHTPAAAFPDVRSALLGEGAGELAAIASLTVPASPAASTAVVTQIVTQPA